MTRRYRGSRNKRRRNVNSNILAAIIFLISILIISGMAYLYLSVKNQKDEIDQSTFCKKGKAAAITTILIDHTDNINPIQRAALEKRLWDIANSIPKNSLLKVYTVRRGNKKIADADLTLCNPGSSEKVSDITGNKVLAEKRYEEKFKIPLKRILDEVENGASSNESPIMESIQAVAVTSFIGDDKTIAKKKLILVSDLLEHTSRFSVYKETPDIVEYMKSPNWRMVKADLNNVDVEIFTLRRDGQNKLQNDRLLRFWTEYFVNQGARVIHTIAVEG